MLAQRQRRHRIGFHQALGFDPWWRSAKQCWPAIAGSAHMPPCKWGLSSLRIFNARLGPRTWLGLTEADGRVPIINLFNHRLAPREEGYDVRVTRVLDFRGGRATYNSHDGTDLVVPVGTVVAAPAAGVVRVVENLMYRGGLKVLIDHGHGLMSLPCHLSRAFAGPGDLVEQGQPVGLSGYSGVDGVVAFPWVAPHVHLTVLHNGEPTDPFAHADEPSLWRDGNEPLARAMKPGSSAPLQPRSDWHAPTVDRVLASCRDLAMRDRLQAVEDLDQRAALVAYWRLMHYPMFTDASPLTMRPHAREPRLALPFIPAEVSGCTIVRA